MTEGDKLVKITHLGEEFELIIRRNSAASKIRLRIDLKTGKPLCVLPKYCSVKKGVEFATSNASWVLAKLHASKPKIVIRDGAVLKILGERLIVRYENRLRGVTKKQDGELLVYGDASNLRKKTIAFIKDEVKAHASIVAQKHADRLGVRMGRLSVKDTTSRWGSCSSKGDIAICWRLAFAPVAVLDYVIIHETVHLKHMDHSEKFWKVLGKLFPKYERAVRWLRANAALLQNIG